MKQTMQAAVLTQFGAPLQIKEVPLPVPKAGEVLVKVMASGLCGTDLHIQEGRISTIKTPYIPGHEAAGVVAALGEGVDGLGIGEHVVIAIDVICGVCRFCRTGRENLCKSLVRIGFERDGGHAQYVAVPQSVLYPIDTHVPFQQAAVIPDAVACMYHAIKNQAQVRGGDRVCILGLGGLGFQGIQIAKHFGAWVCCTSRQQTKLELAKQYGVDACIHTKENDLHGEIMRMTDGELCDVVFDNIGIEHSIQDALDLVRPGGKVIVVGYIDDSFTANFQNIMKLEKEIIGMRGSRRQDLVESIRLVERGVVTPFIYRSYPLSEINKAMEDLRSGVSLGRTVLLPQNGDTEDV